MARPDGFPNPDTFRMGAASRSFALIRRRPTLIALDRAPHSASNQPGVRSLQFVQRMYGPPMRYTNHDLTLIARLRRPPPALLSRRRAAPAASTNIRRSLSAGQSGSPPDLITPQRDELVELPANPWVVASLQSINARALSRNVARKSDSQPSIQRRSSHATPPDRSQHPTNAAFDQPAVPALLFVQPQPLTAFSEPASFSGSQRTDRASLTQSSPVPQSVRLLAQRKLQPSPHYYPQSVRLLVQPQRLGVGAATISRWSHGRADAADRSTDQQPHQAPQLGLLLVQPQRLSVGAATIPRWSHGRADTADRSTGQQPHQAPQLGLLLVQPQRMHQMAEYTEPPRTQERLTARLQTVPQRLVLPAQMGAASGQPDSGRPIGDPPASHVQPRSTSGLKTLDLPFVQRMWTAQSPEPAANTFAQRAPDPAAPADLPALFPLQSPVLHVPFPAPSLPGGFQRMLQANPRPPSVLQRALPALQQPGPPEQSNLRGQLFGSDSSGTRWQGSAATPIWLQPLHQQLVSAAEGVQAGRSVTAVGASSNTIQPEAAIRRIIQRKSLVPTWSAQAVRLIAVRSAVGMTSVERMLQRRSASATNTPTAAQPYSSATADAAPLEWVQPRFPATPSASTLADQSSQGLSGGGERSALRFDSALRPQSSPAPQLPVQRRVPVDTGSERTAAGMGLDRPWPMLDPGLVQRITVPGLPAHLPQIGFLQRNIIGRFLPTVDPATGIRRQTAPLALEWVARQSATSATESAIIRRQSSSSYPARRATPTLPDSSVGDVISPPAQQAPTSAGALPQTLAGIAFTPRPQIQAQSSRNAARAAGEFHALLQRMSRFASVEYHGAAEFRVPMLQRLSKRHSMTTLTGFDAALGQSIGASASQGFAAPFARPLRAYGSGPATGLPWLRRYPVVVQRSQSNPPPSGDGQNAAQPGQNSRILLRLSSGRATSTLPIVGPSPALSVPVPLHGAVQRMAEVEFRRLPTDIRQSGSAIGPTVMRHTTTSVDLANPFLLVQPQNSRRAISERDAGRSWRTKPPIVVGSIQRFGADSGNVPLLARGQSGRWRADSAMLQADLGRSSTGSESQVFTPGQLSGSLLQRLSTRLIQRLPAPLHTPMSSDAVAARRAERGDSTASWGPRTFLTSDWGQRQPPPGRSAIQRQFATHLLDRTTTFRSPQSGAVQFASAHTAQHFAVQARFAPSQLAPVQSQTGLILTTIQPLRTRDWPNAIPRLQRMPLGQSAGDRSDSGSADAAFSGQAAPFNPVTQRLRMSDNVSPAARPASNLLVPRFDRPPLLVPLSMLESHVAVNQSVQRRTATTNQPADSASQQHTGQANAEGWSWIVRKAATGLTNYAVEQPSEATPLVRPLALVQRSLAVSTRVPFSAGAKPEGQADSNRRDHQPPALALTQPLPFNRLLRARLTPTVQHSADNQQATGQPRALAASFADTLIMRFPQLAIGAPDQPDAQPDVDQQAQSLGLVGPLVTPATSPRQTWNEPSAAESGQRPSVLAQRATDTSLDWVQPARAAQSSQATLQRVIGDESSIEQTDSGSGTNANHEPVDIEALARQVYSRLRRRLRIDAERLGK